MSQFTENWDYLLDGSSSPYYLAFGDPFIADPFLILTFDDIVFKQVPEHMPGYFMRFQIEFTSNLFQFVFALFNLTYLGNLPSVWIDSFGNCFAGGGRYSQGSLGAFGALNGQALNGTVFTVGIYMKGDPDGNNCQLAMKIFDGVTEYSSGFVAISGQNTGQGFIGNNDNSDDSMRIGAVDGWNDLTSAEVDTLFSQPVGSATLTPELEAPVLIAPENGFRFVSKASQLFQWATVTGANYYRLQIATDSAFSDLVVDELNITEISFEVAGLLEYGTRYYWRVQASDTGWF